MTIGILVAASAVPSFGGNEQAQRSVYISAGREARIASYGVPDEKCRPWKEPDIVVTERPSYGTLSDKLVRIIAERPGVAQQSYPCLGKFIEAVAVYYRPAKGFRGSDRIRLRVTFPMKPPASPVIREEEIFIVVR